MQSSIIWQRLEGFLIFASALSLYGFGEADFPIWMVVLLFFSPDLFMVFYAFGAKIGAFAYNLVHLYATGTVIMALGFGLGLLALYGFGLLVLGHAGFDRMQGYGLKEPEGFKVTHLGRIGRSE